MRHIILKDLIAQIFSDAAGKKEKQRLARAHLAAKAKAKSKRQEYIDKNGSSKWSPIKNLMTARLGKKCWYTEAQLLGADLTIDHYRPKCAYWWLAFDTQNYRVACHYSNSPKYNQDHSCSGGKGDEFPLLPPGKRARNKKELRKEKPVILDPCNKADCDLLVFEGVDGRPKLNPKYGGNPTDRKRVDDSMIFLNLDHGDFNEAREELYLAIKHDVETYEELPAGAISRKTIRARLEKRLAAKSPFSTAARYYLKLHRHLRWVEGILKKA